MNTRTSIHCLSAALIAGALIVPAISACSTPAADSRTKLTGPPIDSFKPVADMLGKRCGSLDCHGSVSRNLRIYSFRGLRLDPADYPGGHGTRDAEYQATYYSVLTLEPEILGQVLYEHGANPERLTIVRKARGAEAHKGGTVLKTGGDADHCLLSWLAGQTDKNACTKGGTIPNTPVGF